MRQVLGDMVGRQANRLLAKAYPTRDDLTTLDAADVPVDTRDLFRDRAAGV